MLRKVQLGQVSKLIVYRTCCHPVSAVCCSAAAHLGLSEGLLVAQGGSDAFIGMVGLGVVRAGQMAMLTGDQAQ
jgi:ribulose kinase